MTPRSTVHSRRLHDGQSPTATLQALLDAVGGLSGRMGAGDRVLIKPNFVAPFPHATTDLALITFFVEQVRKCGATPVIGESSGYEFDTVAAFEVLGVNRLADELDVELVNLDDGPFREVELGAGIGSVAMSKLALEAKLIINLPVLKGHTITRMTGAVKNFFGLIGKPSRRRLHSRALEPAIAEISRVLSHSLHFVDARRKLQRAVFAESEPLGYMLAGQDPFALDHLGAQLLDIEPDAVLHLAGAPGYSIEGAAPTEPTALSRRSSLKATAHRAVYSTFYWLDEKKTALMGGRSIIYDLHWYLGIHPELHVSNVEDARRVADSCPVGAVDVAGLRIDKERCQKVRCLQCYREHPALVRLGGLNRPRKIRTSDLPT